MPIMDGYAATRAIREQKKFQALPIIAMTANASSKDREKCLDSGMDDHVSKPIDPKKLFTTLATWLARNGKGITETSSEPSPDKQQHSPSKTIAPLMSLPGIDIEEGLDRFAGDQEVYQEIMLTFLSVHGDDAEKIHGLLTLGENTLAIKMLHTLKGSAGNLAANELYTAICELEACLKSNDREESMGTFLETLDQCMSTVCQSLQTLKPLE